MQTLFLMLWIFDIAALFCMVAVFFSQHYCSMISLAFINIIPPVAMAITAGIEGLLSCPGWWFMIVLATFAIHAEIFHRGL